MIVFVCGLSRSGKSHMLEAVLVNCTGVQHLRASELLRASGRPTALISAADALLNQEVFIAAAKAAIERTSDNIIIDGHLMIESADGPQLVPETCFDALPLVGMVVIEAPPTEIVRRHVEIEPALTADEAADRMELERIHARRIARRRNIGFAAVESGDVDHLYDELARMFGPEDRGRADR